MTVSEPELVVTQAPPTYTPVALSVPLSAVPVMLILPVPVAAILTSDDSKQAPIDVAPLPLEIPIIVSAPLLVVMQPCVEILEKTLTPLALLP